MNFCFKRLLSSASVGGLFGFVLGAALTSLVLFLNKTNDMLPEMMLITLPERLLYSIGGFNQTPEYREMLLRVGRWPTIIINGSVIAVLCVIVTLILKPFLKEKTIEHHEHE